MIRRNRGEPTGFSKVIAPSSRWHSAARIRTTCICFDWVSSAQPNKALHVDEGPGMVSCNPLILAHGPSPVNARVVRQTLLFQRYSMVRQTGVDDGRTGRFASLENRLRRGRVSAAQLRLSTSAAQSRTG